VSIRLEELKKILDGRRDGDEQKAMQKVSQIKPDSVVGLA
jgi:hypothetical protein